MSIADQIAVAPVRARAVEDGLRHDWTTDEIAALFALPFADLMFRRTGGISTPTACR